MGRKRVSGWVKRPDIPHGGFNEARRLDMEMWCFDNVLKIHDDPTADPVNIRNFAFGYPRYVVLRHIVDNLNIAHRAFWGSANSIHEKCGGMNRRLVSKCLAELVECDALTKLVAHGVTFYYISWWVVPHTWEMWNAYDVPQRLEGHPRARRQEGNGVATPEKNFKLYFRQYSDPVVWLKKPKYYETVRDENRSLRKQNIEVLSLQDKLKWYEETINYLEANGGVS